MRSLAVRCAAAGAAAAVLAAAPGARAQESSTAYDGVVGTGAAVCSLVYAPLKVVYASGGLLLSGLAWVWTAGDGEIAGSIFRSAVGGDYVVTPAHLEGSRNLRFRGS